MATVIVVGPIRVIGPGAGIDNAWAAGLNLGRQFGKRFGRDLNFTFGPWGFLDVPLVISRPDFLLGLGFAVTSVVAAWLFILAVLRPKMRGRVALVVSSLLTLTLSSVSSPSFLLSAVALAACVRYLRQIPSLSGAWCPVAVAGLAALLLQIKFSEGVAVSVLAFIASLASPRARVMRTASFVLTWLVSSLLLWVVAGQSVSDVGVWLRASMDFVAGYTSAMSAYSFTPFVSLMYLMALLLFVSVAVLGRKRGADRSVVSHLGSLFVIACALFFGFKQAFTRVGPEHNATFFVIAALLLCLVLERGPNWRATALLIALSSLIASPALATYMRGNPVWSWTSAWQVLTSDDARAAVLNQARTEDQVAFGLSRAMVEATRGHAVSVDPWEVSIVWAYSMRWRPMPVFQSYAAYTAHLDQLNAVAAQSAGDDQMIIRATTVSTEDRRTVTDGRNPMWESPRYTLSLLCNYSFVTANKRWMLLRKTVNRCGDPSTMVVRQVTAGEPVIVPSSVANEIVVTSFVPTKPNILVSLRQLVFKDPEPLMVSVDGTPFRLPDGLASGPLLTVMPSMLGWPAEFRGRTSGGSMTFSRPGQVQFRAIHLTG